MILSITLLEQQIKLMVRKLLHCCRLPFFGTVIIKDCFHCVGYCPVSKIFWQITRRASIMALLPACTSSAGMLSTPAAFPFFRNFTASFTSSLRTGKLSVSVVREVLSFFVSPVARYEYRSAYTLSTCSRCL